MTDSGQLFEKCWLALNDPLISAEERAGNYIILTSHLKDPNIGQEFYHALFTAGTEFIGKILEDITCKSCDHAALQVLGYCLYLPSFCQQFDPQMVEAIVNGVCGVIKDSSITKSVCTRALWTLSNQRLALTNHVTTIITVVTELVLSPRLATATVDSEALNVLIRLSEQCSEQFSSVPHLWHPTVFTLALYGLPKISSKALSLSVAMTTQLIDNQAIITWLTKELKKNAISKMLSQLSSRSQDNCHVIRVWSHVITVLGKSLHKQGSFLNDLLRVIEAGFKHRDQSVQLAAYNGWSSLIGNHARDPELLTSPKRLKLLLMPLVASAAKDKHELVEHARIKTYWNLIGSLGSSHKQQLFQQVCVPFLLLCLGLDPKTDVINLMSQFRSTPDSARESPGTPQGNSLAGVSMETPQGQGLGTLAVTPTPAKNAESAKTPEAIGSPEAAEPERSLWSVSEGVRSKYNVGDLFKFICSKTVQSKYSEHYNGYPSVVMAMTGCHAFLQFIGIKTDVPDSLLKSDSNQYAVFPNFLVPMETAEFFLLFLDCLLYHSQLFITANKEGLLELTVHHLFSLLVCCIDSEQAPPSNSDYDPSRAIYLFNTLVRLVDCGCFDNVLCKQMRCDLLRQLCSIPAQCSVGAWQVLLEVLLRHCQAVAVSDWFSSTFYKLLTMVTTPLVNSEPLENFTHLLIRLDNVAKEAGANEEHLLFMWLLTTKAFCSHVTKTNQINRNSSLDPDLSLVGLILKFPFLHLIPNGNKETISQSVSEWVLTFDLCARHTALIVRDPNHCTELVVTELYSAFGDYVKVNKNVEVKDVSSNFDQYQNAMATAVHHLVTKLSWGHLQTAGDKGQRSKCTQTILSLISWQLVTLRDSVKPPLSLCQLTTLPVIMATVSSLYQQILSDKMILMVTETLSQPLTTCWEAILHGDSITPTMSPVRQRDELLTQVTDAWRAILSTFQTHYSGQFNSQLLEIMAPLLVTVMSSQNSVLLDITLTFWRLTFDKHPSPLTYPPRLRKFFVEYICRDKHIWLSLPGLRVTDPADSVHTPSKLPQLHHSTISPHHSVTKSPSCHGNTSTAVVVHPVTSPRKNIRGSFMNRTTSTPPRKPHPLSPAAKALNEVLARSAGGSHDQQGGVLRSTEPSARRKLSLHRDTEKEHYVHVAPPPKKPRLLTEHQKERRREQPTIPTLYNALDNTQEMSSLPLSETQSIDDDVVIIGQSPPTSMDYSADSAVTPVTCTPPSLSNAQANTLNSTINSFTTISVKNMASSNTVIVTMTTAPVTTATTSTTTVSTPPINDQAHISNQQMPEKQLTNSMNKKPPARSSLSLKTKSKVRSVNRDQSSSAPNEIIAQDCSSKCNVSDEPTFIKESQLEILKSAEALSETEISHDKTVSPETMDSVIEKTVLAARVNEATPQKTVDMAHTGSPSLEANVEKSIGDKPTPNSTNSTAVQYARESSIKVSGVSSATDVSVTTPILQPKDTSTCKGVDFKVVQTQSSVKMKVVDKNMMTTIEDTQMELGNEKMSQEAGNDKKMSQETGNDEKTSQKAGNNEKMSQEAGNDKNTKEKISTKANKIPKEAENGDRIVYAVVIKDSRNVKEAISSTDEEVGKDKTKLSETENASKDLVPNLDPEDPLHGVTSKVKLSLNKPPPGIDTKALWTTPTHKGGEETGPTGILKHTSQFDTPSTAKSERRVQFAHQTSVRVLEKEGQHKTPKHSRGSRTPQGTFSSRRTLITPPRKMIAVPRPAQTPPSGSCDPVYPSLSECSAPIDQILPSLTASKFTHGLVQLVRARNITTVGNISSLTEQQVQTLPIKSPKVVNLVNALRTFEENLGSKRKASSDSDTSLIPPAKMAKLNSDLAENESESVFEESESVIPSTPEPLDLSSPDSQMVTNNKPHPHIDSQMIAVDSNKPHPSIDSQMVAMGNDKSHPPIEDLDVTPDLLPVETEALGTDNAVSSMEVKNSEPLPIEVKGDKISMETSTNQPLSKGHKILTEISRNESQSKHQKIPTKVNHNEPPSNPPTEVSNNEPLSKGHKISTEISCNESQFKCQKIPTEVNRNEPPSKPPTEVSNNEPLSKGHKISTEVSRNESQPKHQKIPTKVSPNEPPSKHSTEVSNNEPRSKGHKISTVVSHDESRSKRHEIPTEISRNEPPSNCPTEVSNNEPLSKGHKISTEVSHNEPPSKRLTEVSNSEPQSKGHGSSLNGGSVSSLALHDHIYYSKGQPKDIASEAAILEGSQDDNLSETDTNRDKLSMVSSDHTYCKVGVVSSEEINQSQELFSCHGDANSTIPDKLTSMKTLAIASSQATAQSEGLSIKQLLSPTIKEVSSCISPTASQKGCQSNALHNNPDPTIVSSDQSAADEDDTHTISAADLSLIEKMIDIACQTWEGCHANRIGSPEAVHHLMLKSKQLFDKSKQLFDILFQADSERWNK